MNTKQNKKGIMLNTAFPAVLAVVLIAIAVIIGIFVFQNLQGNFTGVAATTINETGSLTGAGYTLANSSDCNYANPTILQVINSSSGLLIDSGNWTLTGSTLVNATDLNIGGIKITYSYTWGGQPCDATASMLTQFAAYPALVGLVGTIVFLAIVIGVLVLSFAFGRKNA